MSLCVLICFIYVKKTTQLYARTVQKTDKLFSGWYEINLDKRKLRTPAGSLFRVPHEALALAVATEWNGQDKVVKRHAMHLVSLVLIQ